MTAPRLRRIDLDGFRVEDVPLPRGAGALTVGRRAPAEIVISSGRVGRQHCRFLSDDAGWRLEDVDSAGGTWLNGRRIGSARLSHGDAAWFGDTVLIFLDRPEVANPGLEAAVGEQPEDDARGRVWADWLLDHGDPLGEHLLASQPQGPALDGLEPIVRDGRLELDWQHGLIRAARLRCVNDASYSSVEVLARLVSLRVARWLSTLTVDLSTWVMPSTARLERDLASVLRGLAEGPPLPALRRLSLGYLVEPLPASSFVVALLERLRKRSPRLESTREDLLPVARRARLEVEWVPPELNFHHAGPGDRTIPLDAGVWVGSSAQGSLRAVPPGVRRAGLTESFLVRQEPPLWCLVPIDPGVSLNGHPAVPTRLLPDDVVEDPRGVRFRFEIA